LFISSEFICGSFWWDSSAILRPNHKQAPLGIEEAGNGDEWKGISVWIRGNARQRHRNAALMRWAPASGQLENIDYPQQAPNIINWSQLDGSLAIRLLINLAKLYG
jgi:hypothetical protein